MWRTHSFQIEFTLAGVDSPLTKLVVNLKTHEFDGVRMKLSVMRKHERRKLVTTLLCQVVLLNLLSKAHRQRL